MSGIAGIWNRRGEPLDPSLLCRMADAAAYRGRDGSRFWLKGPVGLAHLALHSTPESVRECQPVANQAETCWLTADARIDNRAELVHTLAAGGVGLEHPTDADLILAAYDAWGEACAEKLLGDFAFALWDAHRRQLFAARDIFGARAFYYVDTPARFAWASEVKQLLVDPAVGRELNERVMGAHLCACARPQDETFYQAVRQLAPGHALRVNEAGVTTWRHGGVVPEREIRYARADDYAEHLRELLVDAVRVRLRSVKPVFIKLSGGIDSSSITAVAAHLARIEPGVPPIHALHATYDELPDADEQRYARPVVEHCGIPAHWIPADGLWPFRDYPERLPDRDAPESGTYTYWNRTLINAAAASGGGVVLSGYWGDGVVQGSVFGLADFLGHFRLGEWYRSVNRYHRERGKTYKQLVLDWSIRPLVPSALKRLKWAMTGGKPSAIPYWIRREYADRVGLRDLIESPVYPGQGGGHARQMIYRYVAGDLGPHGAVALDRLAAQAGIDYRYPFADTRLLRFALAVPPEVWFRNGVDKVLLRQAMDGFLPGVIRDRTHVVLPLALFERAMREREVDKIRAFAACPQLTRRGLVAGNQTRDHYERYVSGAIDAEHPFSWALTAEMWLQQFFA